MQAELASATAGLIATAPMTAAMEVMHRLLPEHERYPLPPREIVDNAMVKADRPARRGVTLEGEEEARVGLSLASHFAFGAMAGSAYGAIARTEPSHPILTGIGFGVLVWITQYLGVLPAAGLLSNATRHPARRNALMIAAHVVWGASLGAIADRLTSAAPGAGGKGPRYEPRARRGRLA